ncbi:class I adenylate-forming enzyme family protein [Micromonospora mirobrigensis]|uniref:Acyl-CoA synthetase (AMP-forming)/AMP-acid ligase II n=1 Tax=Micromonospora mirobrigensis TaxID=262898 RepID=A0A1C4WIS2_9ACTN|nr:AMP-binding protein [Micromonospora mirobrigensis]SCE96069.1 Acyl-CoA synthetase (AMP-forming)/AMP-acid ligase II [Micromonospora mirobrigensis]
MTDRPTSYVHRALELFAGFGDREALVGDGRRLTYAEVAAEVRATAATLHGLGVRPGGAVLVMLGNAVEGPLVQLALHLLGCRTMWIAPVTSRREIDEFVRLAAPEAFLHDARTGDGLGAELAAGLTGTPVFRLGGEGPGVDLVAEVAARLAAGPVADPPAGPAPESFLQTSGTTGTPKLVHHRQSFYDQILVLAAEFRAAGFPLLRHLSHSPMWLASGQITTLFNLFTGGVLFLRQRWDPAAFVATVPAERINSTFVTPPMLYEVLDHPALDGADFSTMFMFNVGAGPAAPARLRQAIARFGPCLRIVYGLSEAVVICALPGLTEDPEHPERLRACGRPYGDVAVEIRDADGTVLPAGVDGEVWVRTKLSFAGYHGQPELTAETLVDGWVRTRDVGHLDADGYLYLVDRLADRILTRQRSWPIYSRPIEDVLAGHPQVRAAAVIGVPDPVAGELPYAYVVPAPGATVGGDELIALVTAELSETWAPGAVEFVDELPLNRSAKVDKLALRARYAATHGEDGRSLTAAAIGGPA